MKMKFKRLGKSSLSLALSVLMIVSTVLVGSSNTIDVPNADEVIGAGVVQNIAEASESGDNSAADSETAKTAAVDDKSIDTSKKSTPNVSGATAPESSGTDYYYLYVNNQTGKSDMKCHNWKEGGNDGTTWPGVLPTEATSEGLLKFEIPSTRDRVQFNWNGAKKQTSTLSSLADGQVFYIENSSKYSKASANYSTFSSSWATFNSSSASNVLYFKKTWSGDTVKCYAFKTIEGIKDYTMSSWPGSDMKLVSGTTDIYKITLDKAYTTVEFNDGSNTHQISNIALQYTSGTTTLSKNYYNNGFGDNYVENTNPTTFTNTLQQVGIEGTVSAIPETSETGDTVEFTVSPPDGFTVYSVKANNVDCSYDRSTGKYSYTVASSNVTVEIVYGYTVYFDRGSLGWSTVYAYAIDSGENALLGQWQGIKMTSLGNGLYSILIPSNTATIVFSKEGKNNDSDQTVDIAVSTDNVGQTWTATSTNTGSTKQTGNWPASYYLRGDNTKVKTVANESFEESDLWSGSDLQSDSKFQMDSNGQYYLDVTLNSGAAFKVIDKEGHWYSPSNSDGNKTMTVGSNNCDLYTRSSTENVTFNGSDNTKCRIYISKTVSNNQASFSVYLKALYTVTINDTRTDPVTASHKYVLENDTVTISSTKNSQNQIPYATYNSKTLVLTKDTNSANFTGTFKMPASDTTVTIGYRNPQTYTVNASLDTLNSNSVYGTYTATTQEVTEGDSVTLTVTHDSEYVPVWEFSNNHYKLISKNTTVGASSGSSASAGKNNIKSSGATTGATSTITFIPTSSVNVYITFTEATAALAQYTGSAVYLFAYTQKPENATAAINNATPIKLYTSNNELFARFTVGSSTDLTNDTIKPDTNYYFAYATENNAEKTYECCTSSSATNDKLLSVTTENAKSALSNKEYNGITINDSGGTNRAYTYLLINAKSKAKEVYVKIGTISNDSVTLRSTSDITSPFALDATVDTSTTSDNTITVYAKTGTIRSVDENDNDSAIGDYDKFSLYSDITLKYADDNSAVKTIDSKPYAVSLGNGATATHYRLRTATAEKNRDIIVTAKIHDNTAQGKYFIKGFCVNGETKGIVDGKSANNEYSFTFKIDSSQSIPIEITPIYYLVDSSDCVTLKVEDFAGKVKSKWGKTISCYAWYEDGIDTNDGSSTQHALGGYPGQPMIEQGGSYYMQVPRKINNKAVKGVTMNNYVWDDVHGGLIGYKDFNGINSGGKEGSNAQTYDYDDFLALSHLDDVDAIIFNFKYNTDNGSQNGGQGTGADTGNFNNVAVNAYPTTTNLNNQSSYTHTGQDETTDWHALVDYHDVPVDLFGNRIDITSDDLDSSKNDYVDELTGHENYDLYANHHYYNDNYIVKRVANASKYYVISDGYVNYYGTYKNGTEIGDTNPNPLKSNGRDYLGEYATMWTVYEYTTDGVYTKIGSLPPSAFITKSTYKTDFKDWLKDNGQLKTLSEKDSIPSSFLDYTATAWDESGVPTAYSMGTDARTAMWTQFVTIYNKCYNMPVEIKYESSIKSGGRDGSNNGINKDIGTRCDGRWYYSRANETDPIVGNVKVWILDNSDATASHYIFKENLDDSTSNRYIEDKFIDPSDISSYTGAVTVANARFTNETPYDLNTAKSFKNKTKAVVTKDDSKNFVIEADSRTINGYDYTVDEKGYAVKTASDSPDTTYKFVKWVLKTGSQLNEMSTNNITTRDMGSNATMIAIYKKVEKDPDAKTLTVIHDLYANHKNSKYSSLTTSSTLDPAVTNGTNGNTYISIKIQEPNNGTAYYYNDKAGSCEVDSEALSNNDSTVTITVYTTPGTDNTVYVNSNNVPGVYMYEDSVAESTTHFTVANTAGNNVAWSFDSANTATGKSTYTTTVGALFGTGENAVTDKTLYFFTNLFRTYINVTVKYYDRDVSAGSHSQPVDMSPEAKEVPLTLTGFSSTDTIAQFSTKFSQQFNVTQNEMDEYRAWTTQKQAKDSLGELDRYNANGTKEGKYKTKFSSYIDDFAYHTDRYGYPQISETINEKTVTHYADKDSQGNYTAASREKWVVFSDASETALKDNDTLTDSHTLEEVSSVVIWLYNWPKSYTVTPYYTPETTNVTTTSAVTYVNDNLYVSSNNAAPDGISGFYNQRLGVVDGRTGVDTNKGTNYLTGYGITSPFFGGNNNGTVLKAVENATYTDTQSSTTPLVFDGWYILQNGKYVKVCTDRSYQNRVTNDMILYAGYRPAKDSQGNDTVGESVVVSVTDVVFDKYIDDQETIQVRFNSQLNVSGADVIDNDPNIKYVSALYFDLPTTDTDGNEIDWTDSDNVGKLNTYLTTVQSNGKTGTEIIGGYIQNHIDKLKVIDTFKNNDNVGSYYRTYTQKTYKVAIDDVTTDELGKVDCFTYKVVTSSESSSLEDHTVTLTSKNRIQFTLPMTYDDYLSKPFLSYVAIKYGDNWYVSDNYVSNLADVTSHATSKTPKGVSTSAFEEEILGEEVVG